MRADTGWEKTESLDTGTGIDFTREIPASGFSERWCIVMLQNELCAIDLFSGCGGVTAGLKKAGIKVLAAVEINETAAATYRENNKEVALLQRDIREVSGEELKEVSGMSASEQLLLVACPPCQGFSAIRRGGENDERNQLVFEFLRLVKELRPAFILMENVAGMSRGKGRETFRSAYQEFEKYYKCKYDVLNAADYGVPQTRKRLVLHGIRNDLYEMWKEKGVEIRLPRPTHISAGKKKKDCSLPVWKTADVILGLPEIEAGGEYTGEGVYNHVCNSMNDINIKRIRYIREHGGNRACLPQELALECHKGKSGHTDVYGILDMKKPAPTITGGCMYYSKGRYGHPYQNRALSAREAARLQSFDDDYIFQGTNAQIALQIGNAVPVELAKASGLYFAEMFRVMKSNLNKSTDCGVNNG